MIGNEVSSGFGTVGWTIEAIQTSHFGLWKTVLTIFIIL